MVKFDPQKAQNLYASYFEEHQYASEVGFDGIMLNEHHNNPLNMMPSINVIESILAKMTRCGRIVMRGNILPIHDNPLRLAEEIAMLDVISGGRIPSGFVRGIGIESLAGVVGTRGGNAPRSGHALPGAAGPRGDSGY